MYFAQVCTPPPTFCFFPSQFRSPINTPTPSASEEVGVDSKSVRFHVRYVCHALSNERLCSTTRSRQWPKLTKPVWFDRFYVCITWMSFQFLPGGGQNFVRLPRGGAKYEKNKMLCEKHKKRHYFSISGGGQISPLPTQPPQMTSLVHPNQ